MWALTVDLVAVHNVRQHSKDTWCMKVFEKPLNKKRPTIKVVLLA